MGHQLWDIHWLMMRQSSIPNVESHTKTRRHKEAGKICFRPKNGNSFNHKGRKEHIERNLLRNSVRNRLTAG